MRKLIRKYSKAFLFSAAIACCSCLWMSSVLPLSLFYLCGFFIFLYPFYSNYRIAKCNYSTKNTYFVSSFIAIYIFFQPVVSESTIHNNFVLAICLCFYMMVDSVLYSIKKRQDLQKIIYYFCVTVSIYMVLDFIIRYTTADFDDIPAWIQANPIFKFYVLKGTGLNGDANNSAAISLTGICLMFFYKHFIAVNKHQWRFLYVFLFLDLVLTCSRAALLAFIFLELFYYFFYKRNIYIKFLDLFLLAAIAIAMILLLANDPSGRTKLEIFERTYNYVWTENDFVKFLFGYGGNMSTRVLGLYGHNPISIYLVEYRLIGFILYCSLFASIMIDVGRLSVFLLIPYAMFSLSFSPIHITYLFTALSIIKHSRRLYGIKWNMPYARIIRNIRTKNLSHQNDGGGYRIRVPRTPSDKFRRCA